jgi:hypothetical protein
MKQVTITWKAFGEPTSAALALDTSASALEICDAIFHQTNVYAGPIWDELEPLLPATRTHTALSVGDEVTVDGEVIRCEPMGWATRLIADALTE